MNDSSKTQILCVGDSNTYGYKPNPVIYTHPEERYSENERWPCQLQQLVGDNFHIRVLARNGMTTDITGNQPGDNRKKGYEVFSRILPRYLPSDILILQLGANDLKDRFHRNAEQIAAGVEKIILMIKSISNKSEDDPLKIILLSPQLVNENNLKPPYKMSNAIERSQQFAHYYSEVAKRNGCIFVDLATLVSSSEVDGIHLDSEGHTTIAQYLYKLILNQEL